MSFLGVREASEMTKNVTAHGGISYKDVPEKGMLWGSPVG